MLQTKHWFGLFIACFMMMLVLLASPANVYAATISTYAMPSIYTQSTTYALKADSTVIPVVGYTGMYDYAHFSMSGGPVTIEVTALGQSSISSYNISPKKLNLSGSINGNKLTFTLSNDEYVIVKVNDSKELIIAADPSETNKPASSGTGIYNVQSSAYNADPTGTALATTAIQSAINDANAYTGGQGIVYVPAGVYKVGNLQLKSNVALYLEGGAVLRFTGNPSDYTANWHKDSQNRDVTWWIYTQNGSSNVKIYGRGTLDGNGQNAVTNNIGNNILVPIDVSNFTLDGLIIRDSASWAITPIRSNNLTFQNFKVFNRFDAGENDGIDVMESQNVTVQHAVGAGLDDPFSTKTWDQATDISENWPGTPETLSNVTFDDVLSWTYCYGLKVGQGVRQMQDGITFKNSVVYDAAVGIGIHHKYGTAEAKNITFDNIDIERLSYTNDNHRTWLAFFIQNGAGEGGGTVSTIAVKNITVRDQGANPGLLKGLDSSHPISGITLENIYMPGSSTSASNLAGMNILDTGYYSGLTILPTQTPEPIKRTNLALNQPVTVSSDSGSTAGWAVDGKMSTRWGSLRTDTEWIYVDLGSSRKIDEVRLFWEAAYAKSYQIQVSANGINWSDVYSTISGNGGTDDISFASTSARYVRMNATERGTGYGYSLWEFEVYGEDNNLAAGATVTFSSSYDNSNWSDNKLNDGQRNSVSGSYGWTSNNSLSSNHTEYVSLDLGSNHMVNTVNLYPRNDSGQVGRNFPIDFTIQTSTDGVNWTTKVMRTGYALPGNAVQSFVFPSASVRYVKVEGTNLRPNPSDANRYRMAFAEMEIYGVNHAAGASVTFSSSYESSNWSYTKLIDGQRNSVSGSFGWTSNNNLTSNHTEYVSLDLGSNLTVDTVNLYPRNDSGQVGRNFPIDFTIQTSTDGVNWTTRVTRTGYALPGNAVQSFSFSSASVRYVKVEGTNLRQNSSDANQYRMAFAEMEIMTNILDVTPPVSASAIEGTIANSWYVSEVRVNLTASDDLTGVKKTDYSTDNGLNWNLYVSPISLTADGVHTLLYRSTDNAGNIEQIRTVQISIDRTSPTVQFVGAKAYTVDQTVMIACAAVDIVSGIVYNPCTEPLVSSPAYQLELGSHNVTIQVTDHAGNIGTGSASYTVQVTENSLANLIREFVTGPGEQGIENSFLKKLEQRQNDALIHEIDAQKGKRITVEQAGILVRLVQALK
ncbi:discoidin domain-containing protein [Paenibacillus sp. Soil750]|uniref:discoidin domain-containing protein n=1 Tax=Paenibacillus sp. Soil750 TaxID=1736398 RepID=UPI0007C72FCC|nr:discoidin domain-containing protein [Paenibacillus sp. Soil750]